MSKKTIGGQKDRRYKINTFIRESWRYKRNTSGRAGDTI